MSDNQKPGTKRQPITIDVKPINSIIHEIEEPETEEEQYENGRAVLILLLVLLLVVAISVEVNK